MPLDEAVVIGDTIYGTMGPYVMKINGTTGKLIASARVCSPMIGPCRITQLGGTLYVATWNNPASDFDPVAFPADWFFNRALWPVNPTTLAVGTAIEFAQLSSIAGCGWETAMCNFKTIRGIGSYVYVVYGDGAPGNMIRVNPTTLAHSAFCAFSGSAMTESVVETIDDDGTHLYLPNPDVPTIVQFEISTLLDGSALNTRDSIGTGTNRVRSVARTAANTAYAVCGTATLVKTVFPSPGTLSTFNLATLQSGVRPFRIRYNSNDARLYIPDQVNNGIIVWNPATDTGIWKSGFSSPIDVCFTASKAWAVQNSSAGVQEIT